MSNLTPKQSGANMTAIKWVINFIIPLLIAFIPVTEAFTQDIKTFAVVSVFAIILIATENISVFATAIALPIAYIYLLDITATQAFSPWTQEMPWMMLGGSVVAIALQKTGLLKRIAYRCILLCGGSYRGVIYGFMILGIITAPVINGVAPRGTLFGALALGICQALNLKMNTRGAAGLGVTALAAAITPTAITLTGSSDNVAAFGVAQAAGFDVPTWTEYFLHMALPQLIVTILTFVAIDFMFRPKEPLQGKPYFKQELATFGKMSGGETKMLIVSVALIALVATSGVHGVAPGHLFVLVAALLMVPGIAVIDEKDMAKVNYKFVFFIAACLSIGVVSGVVGFGSFVSNALYPYIAGSTNALFGGVWALGFMSNFALTPLAAFSGFTAPVAQMAIDAGVNHFAVLYTFINSLTHILFPYEYAPALIVFGYGMISMKDFIKYNAVRAAIGIVAIFAIFIPFWNLIGLL